MGIHASQSIFHRAVLDHVLGSSTSLIFSVVRDGEWSFFSSPQPQIPYRKSSQLVAGESFHMKFKGISHYICSYASGLIYFPNIMISNEDDLSVICNPSTGQYAILPTLIKYTTWNSFLGFDPIDKQFKVLANAYPEYDDKHILTLGTGKMRWRKIHFPITHYPFGERICFNGVYFYLATRIDQEYSNVLVCFDVRSEKFMFIEANNIGDSYTHLLNYKGKLGGVLEDVEKQEWSKYVYTLWADNEVVKVNKNLSVVGMTATGEIVLSKRKIINISTMDPFYVFYFNPERNTLVSVEIQGFGELHNCEVYAFGDHIEDFKLNFMKKTTSISPPEEKSKPTNTSTSTKDHQVKTVAHLNKFDALCLSDDDDDGSTHVKT